MLLNNEQTRRYILFRVKIKVVVKEVKRINISEKKGILAKQTNIVKYRTKIWPLQTNTIIFGLS